MKTNKEYMLREIAGETVLVPTGSASQKFEVDEDTARRDIYGFLRELYVRGIVQDIPELELEMSGEQQEN